MFYNIITLILPIYYYFIVVSFLVSFLLFKQPRTALYLKLFCPFLGVSILVEGYALYLRAQNRSNLVLYSYFTTLEFVFYLYVLSCIVSNPKMRSVIRYTLVLNAFIAVIDIFFIQKNGFNSIAYSFSCLLVISFSIFYFFELFRNPQSKRIINEPEFWICLGLLFYYCSTLPVFGVITVFFTVSQRVINILFILLNIMNIILYTFFIIAFLCRVRIRKYISQ